MRLRTRIASAAAVTAVAVAAFAATANAAPDFSDCPTTAPDVQFCIDVRSTAGTLRINRTEIALGSSLEIRGALSSVSDENGYAAVVPPAGTSGLFSAPVAVPGGIARSSSTSPLNKLTVELKAAGPILVNPSSLDVKLPVKIKVKNPTVGSCRLGSDAQPIVLDLPLGGFGNVDLQPTWFTYFDVTYANSAFALPATRGCDSFYGNSLIDWRFGLPSASGGNALSLTTDFSATFGI